MDGELKVYACRIGGTSFDESCLIMICFDNRNQTTSFELADQINIKNI